MRCHLIKTIDMPPPPIFDQISTPARKGAVSCTQMIEKVGEGSWRNDGEPESLTSIHASVIF